LFLVLSSAFSPLSSNHAISTLRDSISQADNLSESGFTGFEDYRITQCFSGAALPTCAAALLFKFSGGSDLRRFTVIGDALFV
jgi:hypothetical protein